MARQGEEGAGGITAASEMEQIAGRIIAELRETPGSTPEIRRLRKQYSKELAAADRKTVLAVAHELIRSAPHGRFVAYELVHYHAATMQTITEREVIALGQGMKSWGEVDTFACYVSGPAWLAGSIGDATVRRWVKSRDRWWRRAALVSTVPLNSGKRAGVKKTLAICRLLIADPDDMVVKALSWALRKAAVREPQSVQEFLSEYADTLAPRVRREVGNKLTTGLKNPRLRAALDEIQ